MDTKKYLFMALAVLLALPALFSSCAPGEKPLYTPSRDSAFDLKGWNGPLGLYLKDGKVMYKGAEFYGVGFNYYDAFVQLVENDYAPSTAYADNFRLLAQNGIPFARINFSQFWPVTYHKYAADKEKYFEAMDSVVRAAEEAGVGLIATLFWHSMGTSDFCDEPYTAWGDESSRTRAFMAEYVKEVVDRYKKSPAIWAWEFSNEMNLSCDLPNAAELIGATINTGVGTRPTRDERDYMNTPVMVSAMKAFAAEVRKYDPDRLITSGNSAPRPGAWNMNDSLSWTLDTREQLKEILAAQNPEELPLISAHIYGDEPRAEGMGNAEGLVAALKELSDELGRPLFIGEFGGDAGDFGLDGMRENFERVLAAAVENDVPLSAVWSVWSNESRIGDNILLNPELSFVVDAVRAQNEKYRERMGISIVK